MHAVIFAYLILFLGSGSDKVMHSIYSCLCTQNSLLTMLWGPYAKPGIGSGQLHARQVHPCCTISLVPKDAFFKLIIVIDFQR